MAAITLRVLYVRIFLETISRSAHDARRMGGSLSARSSELVFASKAPVMRRVVLPGGSPGANERERVALAKGEGLADCLRSVDTVRRLQ